MHPCHSAQEDREQFAQLIGCSHSSAAELEYFSDETWLAAEAIYASSTSKSDLEARLEVAEAKLRRLREALREPVAELFHIHPDELSEV